MAKIRQLGKLRITTWIIALLMLIASCSLVLTACSGTSDDNSDDTTETPTDTQTFANGNFEFYDDSDGSYLIATPDSWTSSTQGSTSLAKSGTVDTSVNWGEKFVYARTEYEKQQDEDNTEDEPDEYYTDIDSDYDVPGWDLANAKQADDADDLTYENISAAEINAVNPGTHNVAAGTADEENGTHVLMLHNYRSNGYGTAARYASSSITLQAGSAVKFSVWVKTYGLTYNDNSAVNGNRGAYIEVSNTVGGTEQDPLVIQNIDTQALNAQNNNNGWVQYTVYLKASSYASTSFTVYLGLGRTNAVDDNNFEYVQGYAFFDDLEYEVMTAAEYETAVAAETNISEYELDIYSSDAMKVDSVSDANLSLRTFALDLDVFKTAPSSFTLNNVTIEETSTIRNGNKYTLDNYLSNADLLRDANDAGRSGIKTVDQITAANGYANSVTEDFNAETFTGLFGENAQILMLYSGAGAPYSTEISSSNTSVADLFKVSPEETLMIRFWVKTSSLDGGTGATVTLIDYETETAIGAVDTTTLTAVDLKDDNGTDEDIFDGWQQCYFYVSNDTKDDLTFTLKFNFGPTDIVDTTISSYVSGYAAFTGFEYTYLSDEEASLASTGTYAVQASLTGSPAETNSGTGFDDPAYTDSTEGSAAIESGFADLRTYDGVYGNSKYVGGTELTSSVNQYGNAGLINKEYAENYWGTDTAPAPEWLQTVVTSYTQAIQNLTLTAQTWWDTVIGSNSTQPLLIVNPGEETTSYGFIGAETSISTTAYTQVNLRVKLSANATAYIYLIDTTENADAETKYVDPLKYTSGISYRYDSDGNVVTKDPDEDDFDEDTDTLFYKQSNGLWSTSATHSGDFYYANLANYDEDEDGNLTDSDGTIVYYLHDGEYYRYHNEDTDAYSVAVRDFTKAGVDENRLAAATLQSETSKDLVQVVHGSDVSADQWVYVNFFIANGSEAKNYRLEVWNGSRDNSVKMAAESYVIFDSVSYTTLDETNFNNMLSDSLEALGMDSKFNDTRYATTDEILKAYRENPNAFISENANGASLIYYNFSLFDDKNYTPYDENNDLDTRDSDPYADYDPSSYSDTVAYLRYNGSDNGYIEYNTFVNYGASEIDVATSDGSTDDSTTDDTTGGGSNTNLWLLIPSIILAAALFITLISMLVKKLLGNIRRNKVRTTPQYDARRTRYIRKLKLSEEAEDERDESVPDVLPDEDEIDEEDIYRVEDDTATDEKETDDTDPYADEADDQNNGDDK